MPILLRATLTTLLALTVAGSVSALPPTVADRTELFRQLTRLELTPGAVDLVGSRDVRQVIVTGHFANGQQRDLTHAVTMQLEPLGVVELQEGGFLRARNDGTATLTVTAAGQKAKSTITVKQTAVTHPVSFRHDVIAAMNVGGCNMGACHGTPSGKNGFKLSLRGFDPAADYLQLSREQFGRRSDKHTPLSSLILLKGLGRVPHEGGARFGPTSLPVEMMATWLGEGMQDDAATLPAIKSLVVSPASRVQLAPARWQQLTVQATTVDGRSRDVTRLTNFSSSEPAVAEVTANGFVEFKRPGEVAILCRYLEEMVSVRLMYLEPREGFLWPTVPEVNFIDTQVFAKLKQMTILPSELCTDYEFIRRVYLDAVGRMPTGAESRLFLADKASDKRAKLIEHLLVQPEFADFWTLKWADVLRSSRKSIQLKGSHAFHEWLRRKIGENTPIDTLVRELLTANGNTFANPPANYFRIAKDPTSLAESTAQLFMGVRMQCAKCHNHPFERWTQDDYYGFAAWFARIRQKPEPAAVGKPNPQTAAEVIYATRDGEVTQPRTGKVMKPRYISVGEADVKPGADRRDALAEWLTSPGNPFFAKSVVNRVWFHLMGKGIVDPVDDFRDSNPSSNDALLDALAKEFATKKFDLRHLIRTILNSRTYQLSAVPNDTNKDDTKYFSHAVTKLLTAEQLLDALCDVTAVPEKYAGLPAGTRAVQLIDGEVNHPFLKAFGQPARELACECERESDGNLGQALQLINGPTVNEKVRNPTNRLGTLLNAKKKPEEILEDMYFAALARAPFPDEQTIALKHIAKGNDPRKSWEDVLWAIVNTREFLFRH